MQIFRRGIAAVLVAVILLSMNTPILSVTAQINDQSVSSGKIEIDEPVEDDDTEPENSDMITGNAGEGVDFYFNKQDGSLTISGTGTASSPKIDSGTKDQVKSLVVKKGITALGDSCFNYYRNLEAVTLPDSVESIGEHCFYGCSALQSLTLGSGLTKLGDSAFSDCSALTELIIPDTVTSIGNYCFSRCNALQSLTLGKGLTKLGDEAFRNCSALTQITIPDGVTEIGSYCFDRCTALASVKLSNKLSTIGNYAFNQCNSLKEIEIPDSVGSIGGIYGNDFPSDVTIKAKTGSYAYYYAQKHNYKFVSTGNAEFKGTFNGNISYVYDASKKQLTVSGSGFVGDEAELQDEYYYDSTKYPWSILSEDAQAIVIGKDITGLGRDCFDNFSKLKTVTLNSKLTYIGYSVFSGSPELEKLEFPDSVTVCRSGFFGCESLTVYAKLGGPVWLAAAQAEVNFSSTGMAEGSVSVEDGWSDEEKITATMDFKTETLTLTGNGATGYFIYYQRQDCSRAPWDIFADYTKTLVIKEGITCISDGGFHYFNKLTTVELPDSLLDIENGAFSENPKFTVKCKTGSTGSFYAKTHKLNFVSTGSISPQGDLNENVSYKYDTSSKTLTISGEGEMSKVYNGYDDIYPWYLLRNDIEAVVIENGVTYISESAFAGCTSLKTVKIPDSVTEIGREAFAGCASLPAVDLGKNVTIIGSSVFGYCYDGESGEQINCSSLKTVTLSDAVKMIDSRAFENCTALTEITLPNSLTEISSELFSGCKQLSSVSIPDSVTKIRSSAFYGCKALKTLSLPKNLTEIGDSAFRYCDSLKELSIPDSVTNFGENVFDQSLTVKAKTGSPASGYAILNNINFESTGKMNLEGSRETYGGNSFKYFLDIDAKTLTLSGKGTLYCYPKPWEMCSPFVEKVVISSGITDISSDSFKNFKELKSVSIADTVQKIEYEAFSGCTAIKNLTLPDSVTDIGYYAFAYCTELKEIHLGKKVNSIADNAFNGIKEIDVYCYSGTKAAEQLAKMSNVNVIYTDALNIKLRLDSLSSESAGFSWSLSRDLNSDESIKCYRVYGDGKLLTETTEASFAESGLGELAGRDYEVSYVDNNNVESKKFALKVKLTDCDITEVSFDEGRFKDGVVGGEANYTRVNAYITDPFFMNNASYKVYTGSDKNDLSELKIKITEVKSAGYCYFELPIYGLETGTYYLKFSVTPESDDEVSKTIEFEVDKDPPSPVTGLKVYGKSNSVYLNWDKGVEADVNGYHIFRRWGQYSFRRIKSIEGRDNTSYTDATAVKGEIYDYIVVAYDRFAQYAFIESSEYIATGGMVDDTEPPRIFSVTPKTGSVIAGKQEFRIVVSDDVQVEKTEAYYSEDKQSWKVIAEGSGDNWKPEIDTTTFPEKVYLKFKSTDTSGNSSEFTDIYEYTVDNKGPQKITGVQAESITVKSATLKWDKSADKDAAYFEVEQKIDGEFVKIASSIYTLGYNLTGLEENTSYTYRVLAYDFYGNRGTESDEITFTTPEDSAPPQISDYLPLPGKVNYSIDFNIKAYDDTAVGKLVLYYSTDKKTWTKITTQEKQENYNSTTFAYKWDISDFDEGKLYVKTEIFDKKGHVQSEECIAEYEISRKGPKAIETINATADATSIYIYCSPYGDNPDLDDTFKVDVAGINVYRSTEPDGEYSLIAERVKGHSYLDKDVQSNTVYYYKVRGLDNLGNVGDLSAAVSAQTVKDETAPIITINGSRGDIISSDSMKIGFYAVDDVYLSDITVSYKIDGKMSEFKQLFEKSEFDGASYASSVDLSKLNLTNVDKVIISAQATDRSGNISDPTEKEFTAKVTIDSTTGLSVGIDDEENVATISWQGSKDEDTAAYYLERSTDGGQTYERIGAIEPNDTGKFSYDDTELSGDMKQIKYRIIVQDNYGNKGTDVSENKRCNLTSKPVATINCIDYGEVGVEYTFDATDSNKGKGNVSYTMDFGDGTISKKGVSYHKYYAPGEYIFTLTVTNSKGMSNTLQKVIKINNKDITARVSVHVVDTDGHSIQNARVYIDPEAANAGYYILPYGSTMMDPIPLYSGLHTFVATAADSEDDVLYRPTTVRQFIYPGSGNEVTIVVEKTSAVNMCFDIKEMTFEQITAAGIDVSDPKNQHMVKLDIWLKYPEGEDDVVSVTRNIGDTSPFEVPVSHSYIEHYQKKMYISFSKITSYNNNSYSGDKYSKFLDEEGNIITPVILEIPQEITFLKDFYTASLTIQNCCDREFVLTDNTVELNLPNGLTMIDQKQENTDSETYANTAKVEFDDLEGGQQHTVHWIFRAEEPGEYNITADHNARFPRINTVMHGQTEGRVVVSNSNYTDHVLDICVEYSSTGDEKNVYADVYICNKGIKPFNHIRAQCMGDARPYACYLVKYGELEDGVFRKRENIKIDYSEFIDVLEPEQSICYRYVFETEEEYRCVLEQGFKFEEGAEHIYNISFVPRSASRLKQGFEENTDTDYYASKHIFRIKVINATTREPIPEATVTLSDFTATSGDDGYAYIPRDKIRANKEGNYGSAELTIEADGFKPCKKEDYSAHRQTNCDTIGMYSFEEDYEIKEALIYNNRKNKDKDKDEEMVQYSFEACKELGKDIYIDTSMYSGDIVFTMLAESKLPIVDLDFEYLDAVSKYDREKLDIEPAISIVESDEVTEGYTLYRASYTLNHIELLKNKTLRVVPYIQKESFADPEPMMIDGAEVDWVFRTYDGEKTTTAIKALKTIKNVGDYADGKFSIPLTEDKDGFFKDTSLSLDVVSKLQKIPKLKGFMQSYEEVYGGFSAVTIEAEKIGSELVIYVGPSSPLIGYCLENGKKSKIGLLRGDETRFQEEREEYYKLLRKLLGIDKEEKIDVNNPKSLKMQSKFELGFTLGAMVGLEIAGTGEDTGWAIADLGVTGGINAEGEIRKTLMLGYVPVALIAQLEGSGKVNLRTTDGVNTALLCQVLPTGIVGAIVGLFLEIDEIDASLEAMVKVSAGLGAAEVASLGIFGQMNLDFETTANFGINTEKFIKEYEGWIYGKIGYYLEVAAGLIRWEGSLYNWDKNEGIHFSSDDEDDTDVNPSGSDEEAPQYKLADYKKDRYSSNWLMQEQDDGSMLINDNVPFSSRAKTASANGNTVMVFLGENFNADNNLNSKTLYYSVLDEKTGQWSSPAVLDGNVQSDLEFDLVSTDSGISVIYSQMDREFTGKETDISDIFSDVGVYTAEFSDDRKAFTKPEKLSADKGYNSRISATVIDGIPTAVWCNSTDLFGSDGKNRICFTQKKDGEWTAPVTSNENVNQLYSLEAGSINSAPYAAYIVDGDNNTATADDRELYLCNLANGETVKKSEASDCSNLQRINGSGFDSFVWYQNEALMTFDDSQNPKVLIKDPECGGDFSVCGGDNLSLTYISDGNKIKTISYLGNDSWSDPITVVDSGDKKIGNLNISSLEKQQIYSYTTYTAPTDEDGFSAVNTQLYTKSVSTNTSDLRIDEISCDYSSLCPGESSDLYVTVTNNGIGKSKDTVLTVRDSSGAEIGTLKPTDSLNSGETEIYQVSFTVPEYLTDSPAVTVTDSRGSLDSSQFTFEVTDLGLNVSKTTEADKLYADVNVYNSNYFAGSGKLEIVKEGEVLYSEDIPELTHYDVYNTKVELKDEYISNGKVEFRIVPEKEEYYDYNNSRSLRIRNTNEQPTEPPTQPTERQPTATESKPTEQTETQPTATESTPTATVPDVKISTGDVNGDGTVNVKDAGMILKFVQGNLIPTAEQVKTADIDGDGKVTKLDYLYLQGYFISGDNKSLPTFEDILKVVEIFENENYFSVSVRNGEEVSLVYKEEKSVPVPFDVNGDGSVNVSDAVEIQKYLAGLVTLNKAQQKSADCNNDGIINITDAVYLQKALAKSLNRL